MKAAEQYFHVVLFIMLFKVVITLESADKTKMCDFHLGPFVFVHNATTNNLKYARFELFQGFLIPNFMEVFFALLS